MANKSVGQWVGTIVGAVIGFFIPGSYVALGAAIGGAIGGAIDPPKGPKLVGPRLSDLSVQTASYGSAIPRVYGTIARYGTVIWIENNQLRETEKTEEQGGKGGGGQETTTYSYSVTCAILLCKGPIAGVLRIWAGSKLIYDGSATTAEGVMANNVAIGALFSHKAAGSSADQTTRNGPITVYTGGETQDPNPRMQMTLGIGNVSAYRGYAYVVLEDFQLADYGNSLLGCPFKFEIMTSATLSDPQQLSYHPDTAYINFNHSYGPVNPRIESGVLRVDHDGIAYTLTANGELIDSRASDQGTLPFGHIGFLGNTPITWEHDIASQCIGWLKYGASNFMRREGTTPAAGVWEFHGAWVSRFTARLYVCAWRDGQNYFNIYDDAGTLLTSTPQSFRNFPITNLSLPSIPGGPETFTVEEGGGYLWNADVYNGFVSCYPIAADGTVGSEMLKFSAATTQFMGWFGNALAIAAMDGLCWGATNGGGMFIFSRTGSTVDATVDLAGIIEAECLATGYLTSSDIDTTTITDQVRGYAVTNNAAIRSALEALQAPFPFDVIQDGYKIKFVRRGGTSVATIADADLATTADKKADEPRVTVIREMDSQLPRRIEVSYFDATREYDTGEQAAERMSNTGEALVRIEVPIVMTPDEGACCADMLLYLYHLERVELAFSLPTRDPYDKLQPADPVTIVTPEATYFVRLTSVTHESNRVIKLTAKLADIALYSPTAQGEAATVLSRPIEFTGPSILTILDIPPVSEDNVLPGVILAGRGAYSGWHGASVLRSDDGGVSWLTQAGIPAPGATVALAQNTIGAGPTNAMDVSSVLNVRMESGDISSVSELALFNGANHFAYGEPGRWEIIGARTVSLQGDGSYNLSNLLRGRFGTEWTMAAHAVLDDLVLLDRTSLSFATQPTATIGSPRQWTILGRGDADAAQNARAFTYAGENLECRAPCYAKGYKNGSGDFVMEWIRSSRTDISWRDYVDAALGETSENYEVEIYDGQNYSTLKRTLTALTSPAATYTAAQQAADFGSGQRYLFTKIYQVSANVGKGYPLNAFIGNPSLLKFKSLIHFDGGAPEALPYRVLGLHCNGSNGSTTFTDVCGKTVTANGNAQISTAQYPALTGKTSSAYFDGSGDYLSVPDSADFAFGTGDFTLRCLLRLVSDAASGGTTIFDFRASTSASPFTVYIKNTGTGNFFGIYTSLGTASMEWDGALSLNTWYDLDVVRVSGSWAFRLNGTARSFTTGNATSANGNLGSSSNRINIGCAADGSSSPLNAYISEIEIYKGFPLHTSNFTPQTDQFVDSSSQIIDESGNSITVTGTAATINTDGRFGGSCLLANQGAGYISLPSIDLSTTLWVIDFWFNPVSLPGSAYSGILQFGQATDGTGGFSIVVRDDGVLFCFFDYYASTSAGAVSAGVWSHGFIQRNGNQLIIGANGTTGDIGRTLSNTPVLNLSVPRIFDIGRAVTTYSDPKQIKIDEFCVRIGEAPYPITAWTAYTVPSEPFVIP